MGKARISASIDSGLLYKVDKLVSDEEDDDKPFDDRSEALEQAARLLVEGHSGSEVKDDNQQTSGQPN